MESLSMVLLTVPIFFEIIRPLGIDPVWFGIFVVMITELSLITPPVGLNLFVIKGVVGDLRIGALYAGITPFVIADLVRVALLIALPALALYLPGLAG
jgi:TRAP-type C4-dicarboxylate transport system permease large subunit